LQEVEEEENNQLSGADIKPNQTIPTSRECDMGFGPKIYFKSLET